MFTKIRRRLTQKKDDRIGQAIITEILPRFTDRANSTNKTMWVVKDVLEGDIAEVFEIGWSGNVKRMDTTNKIYLTQNGIPVKFNKKGKMVEKDENFEKNGCQFGKICSFEALGYLGNFEKVEYVQMVTDQYVFFGETGSDESFARSFEELEVLSPKII